jgi:hypothetical protein
LTCVRGEGFFPSPAIHPWLQQHGWGRRSGFGERHELYKRNYAGGWKDIHAQTLEKAATWRERALVAGRMAEYDENRYTLIEDSKPAWKAELLTPRPLQLLSGTSLR